MRRIASRLLTRLLLSESQATATRWHSCAMRTTSVALELHSRQQPWSSQPRPLYTDKSLPRHEPDNRNRDDHPTQTEAYAERCHKYGESDDAHSRAPVRNSPSSYHRRSDNSYHHHNNNRSHPREYGAARSNLHSNNSTSNNNYTNNNEEVGYDSSGSGGRWDSASAGRGGGAAFGRSPRDSGSRPAGGGSFSSKARSSGRRRPESFFIRNAQSLLEMKRQYKKTHKKSELAHIRREADRLLHLTRIDMSSTDEAAVTTLLNCAALLSPSKPYASVEQAVQWMRQNLQGLSLQNVALFTNALGLLKRIPNRIDIVLQEIDPLVTEHVKDFTPVEIVMILQAHQRLSRGGHHDALEDVLVKQLLPCIPVMPVSQLSTLALVLVRHGLRVREPVMWRQLVDAIVRHALETESIAKMYSRDAVAMFSAAALFELPAQTLVALMQRLTETARFHEGEDVVSMLRSLCELSRMAERGRDVASSAVDTVANVATALSSESVSWDACDGAAHAEEDCDENEDDHESEGDCADALELSREDADNAAQRTAPAISATLANQTAHITSSNNSAIRATDTEGGKSAMDSTSGFLTKEVQEARSALHVALLDRLERLARYLSLNCVRSIWSCASRCKLVLSDSIQQAMLNRVIWSLGHQRVRVSVLRALVANTLDGGCTLPCIDVCVAASQFCVGRRIALQPHESFVTGAEGSDLSSEHHNSPNSPDAWRGNDSDSAIEAESRGSRGRDGNNDTSGKSESFLTADAAPRFYSTNFSDLLALRISLENVFAAHPHATPPDSLTHELPHQLVKHAHLASTYNIFRSLMILVHASQDCALRNHDNDAALLAEMLVALRRKQDSLASEISAQRRESVLLAISDVPKLAAFAELLRSVRSAEESTSS